MLKVSYAQIYGIDNAIKAMRNPLNSWSKSDSYRIPYSSDNLIKSDNPDLITITTDFYLGEKDLKLCKALIKAGNSDRKFLRMIHVQADIISPMYWWKEMDQYKIATVTNSCSTMHKIHSRDLTLDDFSTEHLTKESLGVLMNTIKLINEYRLQFVETKDKKYWWQMIQLLPSSYNQMRTWDGNYETLISMYFQRRYHKLDEWHTFCDWIETLPYMKEFLSVLDESIIQDELSREHKEELIRLREKGSVKTEMDAPITPPSNMMFK